MHTTDHPQTPLQAVGAPLSPAQAAHTLIQHLGDVLNLRTGEQVLLASDDAMGALTLAQRFDCQVTLLADMLPTVLPADERIAVETGTLRALPFDADTFDAVIVAIPVTNGLQMVAREVARVLRHNGRLGMVAFSPYRDQVREGDARALETPLMTETRPAAVYRAILGEAGFTAFLTEDRRRTARSSAAAVYREHLLKGESAIDDPALSLLASGSLHVTLITAEKGL